MEYLPCVIVQRRVLGKKLAFATVMTDDGALLEVAFEASQFQGPDTKLWATAESDKRHDFADTDSRTCNKSSIHWFLGFPTRKSQLGVGWRVVLLLFPPQNRACGRTGDPVGTEGRRVVSNWFMPEDRMQVPASELENGRDAVGAKVGGKPGGQSPSVMPQVRDLSTLLAERARVSLRARVKYEKSWSDQYVQARAPVTSRVSTAD